MKEHVRTPENIELAYKDVYIASEGDVTLHGWWLPANTDSPAKGSVYFLHGNAENISTHIASVYWLPEQGYNVFLLDYRGYGLSTGKPQLPDVLVDIRKGWEWVLEQPEVKDKPVYILGQSLGAAMSGYVVATQPQLKASLNGVVLDAGFASYPQVAKDVASDHWLTWAFQWPTYWMMGSDYNLESVVAEIQPTPLMLIHGKQDNVVSEEQVVKLFELAGKPKSLLRYDGPHIATFFDLENRAFLLQFFAENAGLVEQTMAQ